MGNKKKYTKPIKSTELICHMKNHSLSYRKMAKLTGVNPNSLYRYIVKDMRMSIKNMVKIAKYFGYAGIYIDEDTAQQVGI